MARLFHFPRPVRFRFHVLAMCALALAWSQSVQAQDKAFSGLYGGVELGRQNLIGGSLVSNVDFLAQDSRVVFSFLGGARYQFDFGLVIGAELSVGLTDGDLALNDPSQSLAIDYANDRQTAFGLQIGWAVGGEGEWLLFGYLSEVTRDFDVTISLAGETFGQSDEQGMLRYGGGVERAIAGPLHLRATLGSGRADFGDRVTNIDPERELELAVGVIFQF